MDNTNSNNKESASKSPTLCTAGCGFFGSEAFNNMCSKCFKSISSSNTTTEKVPVNKLPTITAPLVITPPKEDATLRAIPTSITAQKRKHRTSISSPPPPAATDDQSKSAPTSAIASPSTSTIVQPPSEINSTANSPIASGSATTTTTTGGGGEKPTQTNKGRCFKCRLKVPLAKQAANKCRCGYVFCDNHRYPDRHDCDIDYAKMDREILAKNNPKLHERPRGGRSFQRIDSL